LERQEGDDNSAIFEGGVVAFSRRKFLITAGGVVVVAAVDVGGLRGAEAAQAFTPPALPMGASPPVAWTSLNQTMMLGAPQAGGYRTLVTGRPEPRSVRGELTPGLAQAPVKYALAAFVQMTDLHVVDDQSPARVEWLDRLTDNGDPGYDYASSYRPHEMFSTHIVDAMCQAIRSVGRGPRTNLPLGFTMVTGDAIDNCQFNETRWYIDLLDGVPIVPDSGLIGVDESVSNTFGDMMHDWAYWAPEDFVYPYGTDKYTGRYGYPRVPGVMAAARAELRSTGLGMPWYTTYGNHDGEIQGNFPEDPDFLISLLFPDMNAIAVGSDKAYSSSSALGPNADPLDYRDMLKNRYVVPVAADDKRRFINLGQFVHEHFTTAGSPPGHGFTADSDFSTLCYAIPQNPGDLVQGLVVNTAASMYADGQIHEGQMRWLETQLRAGSSKYLVPTVPPPAITIPGPDGNSPPQPPTIIPGHGLTDGAGATVTTQSGVTDKLFVIFCHHTLNSIKGSGLYGAVMLWSGDDLRRLLLAYPNVIAVVNGHTHTNRITPYARTAAQGMPGGFWEISTASLIDWPMQSRIIEVGMGNNIVSIMTTNVDLDPTVPHGGPGSPKELAALARELAANDPSERAQIVRNNAGDEVGTRRGRAIDRNTQLLLPAPFSLPDFHEDGSSIALTRNPDGRLEAFGTNPSDLIFRRKQGSAGDWAGADWINIPGALRCIAAATNADGRVEMFGVNMANNVYRWIQNSPGDWTGSIWVQVPGALTSIAAVCNADGRLEIFGTNPNDSVYRWIQGSPGNWGSTGWEMLSGGLTQVAAATNRNGMVELFGVNGYGYAYHRRQSSSGSWANSDWEMFDGLVASTSGLQAGPILMITAAANTKSSTAIGSLYLIGVNGDGQVFQRYQTAPNATTWSPWQIMDGTMTQVAAATTSTGQIELVGVNPDGAIFRRLQDPFVATTWSPWTQLSGVLRPNLPRTPPQPPPPPPPPPPPAKVGVPWVIGLTVPAARATLTGAGLALGSTISDTSCAGQVGTVVDQIPAGGTQAIEGSAVTIMVARIPSGGCQ
jgi:metallophosphoesterase (TIGR03767 family)